MVARTGAIALMLLVGSGFARAQAMPAAIAGTWKIVRILPSHNVTCWDAERARTLLGTTLRYETGRMRWQGGSVAITDAFRRTISPEAFQEEYRTGLAELGVHAGKVEEINLQHEDADVTGATTEVPGDSVLLAGPGRIVISACGVFFSARRAAAR